MRIKKINTSIQKLSLLITVFITGACVLVIELVGTRALAPFFGSGIYTWSALIAITLAALSVGYYAGGKLSDRFPKSYNIYLLILGAGIWTVITPWLGAQILPQLTHQTDLRLTILISSFILFFPNLSLLGAISPYCIRILTQSHSTAGSISGSVFAVSTIGSLLAAVATGFYIIPNYGVHAIFNFCGAVLVTLALIGASSFLLEKKSFALIIFCFIALSFYTTVKSKTTSSIEVLDQSSSFYGHVQVVKKDNIKMLLVDGIAQNYISESTAFTTPYINFMAALPELRQAGTSSKSSIEKKTALVIGLGAGELPALLDKKGLSTEVIEISPTVARFAEKYFDSDVAPDKLHFMDGRVFIAQTNNRYDYIYMDAFSAEQVSWHLVTKEAFTEAKAKLTDDGVLALNLTSSENSQDIVSIQQTLRSVFPYVRSYMQETQSKLTSIVYLASSAPIQLSNNLSKMRPLSALYVSQFISGELGNFNGSDIYTDNFNPISDQRHHVHNLWRAKMREFFEEDELLWLSL